jgi:hypothetical protein
MQTLLAPFTISSAKRAASDPPDRRRRRRGDESARAMTVLLQELGHFLLPERIRARFGFTCVFAKHCLHHLQRRHRHHASLDGPLHGALVRFDGEITLRPADNSASQVHTFGVQ